MQCVRMEQKIKNTNYISNWDENGTKTLFIISFQSETRIFPTSFWFQGKVSSVKQLLLGNGYIGAYPREQHLLSSLAVQGEASSGLH